MPQSTVNVHSKTMFLDTIHNRAQQIRARLKPFVQLIKIAGKQTAYDGLGTVEAQEITGRFNEVIFSDIEHTRRKIPRRRFAVAIPIDQIDVNDIMQDPENMYATAIVRAMERVFDRLSVEAAFASIQTGEDFSTSVTATADGVVQVDATSGLVYDHLLELSTNFINNDVGTDMPESFFLAVTGDEHRALLSDYRVVQYDASGKTRNNVGGGTLSFTASANSENVVASPLTNSDFTNRSGQIDDGRLVRAAGFNIIPFAANAPNPVIETLGDSDDYRRCVAASTRGIIVGIHDSLEVDTQDRTDLVQTKQIIAVVTMGALRTEGVLIQELQTPWAD